ncbi:MAG: HAD family hydrolase [Treponema sp.]|nr:HAD family hydrolase [Treponema sp.]
MLNGISVIAFDIDGTLYPSWALYLRVVPYFLANLRFFLHYNKVRKQLHHTAPLPDFYEYQGRLLAKELDCTVDEAKEKINRIVYDGLRPYFTKLKPFSGMQDAIRNMKAAGYRIAILSDFPPAQKGNIWGILSECELVLGSEELGALKPSKYPFGVMAQLLKTEPEHILYVGNSKRCDVRGANNAGMKSAFLLPLWRRVLHRPFPEADISFGSYRQLQDIVLQ